MNRKRNSFAETTPLFPLFERNIKPPRVTAALVPASPKIHYIDSTDDPRPDPYTELGYQRRRRNRR